MSDSTNSVKLIEDWRERWEPVTKNGNTVLAVAYTGNEIQAWLTDNKGAWTCNQYNLTRKPRPKTYRPWKREEVPVGSVVRIKDGNAISVIGCIDDSIAFINVTGVGWRTPDRLLLDFVLHATNPDGTWIPTEQCPKCGVEE